MASVEFAETLFVVAASVTLHEASSWHLLDTGSNCFALSGSFLYDLRCLTILGFSPSLSDV